MTTSPRDPVQRNEAGPNPDDRRPHHGVPNESTEEPTDEVIDHSIDESMAEADLANGEGDPGDASQIHRNGEDNGEDNGDEDQPKAMRRAE